MNVSDYIIDFFAEKGIEDIFGYQGTMITYFVDAIYRSGKIKNHSCYNEQGAAFAACGLAQASGKTAVAYSTSGPGAVNLLSGVANAYFDSLPVIFITGQINTYEYAEGLKVRQHSFQEMDVVNMSKPVSKYAVQITDANNIRYELEKAWYIANNGRKGSVVLDIPMNVQRTEIEPQNLQGYESEFCSYDDVIEAVNSLEQMLGDAERPVIILGNGVAHSSRAELINFARNNRIPIVSSLLAKDFLPEDDELNFGYLGSAYGKRYANMLCAAKADLLISIGSSLCFRQVGTKVELFAQNAKLFRIDCDSAILQRKIKADETSFCVDSDEFIKQLKKIRCNEYSKWFAIASEIKNQLHNIDDNQEGFEPNEVIKVIDNNLQENRVISVDVGQHMMWAAQSLYLKQGQKLLFSGGHGAMGYGIPAAIGAYYHKKNPVYCITGDGSFQMNVQELQWIARENLPIKIFVLNNGVLGMVHFTQGDYFEGRYGGTAEGFDYSAPNLIDIGSAYGIRSYKIEDINKLSDLNDQINDNMPAIFEIILPEDTAAYPKTFLGEPIYNQRPYIPANIYDKLLKL